MVYSENKTVNLVLVEDDDADAKALHRAFTKARIANPMHRTFDGIDALELLRGENNKTIPEDPFMLLVDLNMPRMGGIEMVTELRRDPKLKHSIVFILTTSKSEEDICAAYDLNVAGYIVKERAGDDFLKLLQMLDCYWRIVEMPDSRC